MKKLILFLVIVLPLLSNAQIVTYKTDSLQECIWNYDTQTWDCLSNKKSTIYFEVNLSENYLLLYDKKYSKMDIQKSVYSKHSDHDELELEVTEDGVFEQATITTSSDKSTLELVMDDYLIIYDIELL